MPARLLEHHVLRLQVRVEHVEREHRREHLQEGVEDEDDLLLRVVQVDLVLRADLDELEQRALSALVVERLRGEIVALESGAEGVELVPCSLLRLLDDILLGDELFGFEE